MIEASTTLNSRKTKRALRQSRKAEDALDVDRDANEDESGEGGRGARRRDE